MVAFIDTIGRGSQNATFPTGASTTVNVTSSGVTGVTVSVTDPAMDPVAVPSNVGAMVGDNGAFLGWDAVQNTYGVERVTSYDVSLGTDLNASTGGAPRTCRPGTTRGCSPP